MLIRSANADEDLKMLARAKFKAGLATPERDHIDVVVEADDPEAARQQVNQTLGRDRGDYVFTRTERVGE